MKAKKLIESIIEDNDNFSNAYNRSGNAQAMGSYAIAISNNNIALAILVEKEQSNESK